jgi:hypothetical protein
MEMGWLIGSRPAGPVKAHMDEKFCWETDSMVTRVLDSAIVNLLEYYAAVERKHKDTGKVEVFAVVCKLYSSRTEFGYKDMDESVGPAISNCPRRILELLTEPYNVFAQEWRDVCWARVQQREAVPPLKSGTELRFNPPIRFSSGAEKELLTVVSARGGGIRCADEFGTGGFRLTRKFLETKVKSGGVVIHTPKFVT